MGPPKNNPESSTKRQNPMRPTALDILSTLLTVAQSVLAFKIIRKMTIYNFFKLRFLINRNTITKDTLQKTETFLTPDLCLSN